MTFLWKLKKTVGRLRAFGKLMSPIDALRLTNCDRGKGVLKIHLLPLKRDIYIRRATTDLACFEKIFCGLDYESPFDISPLFIVDAGANTGMATLYFAMQYPNANIVAIEPEASNFALLRQNCGDLPNVRLVNAALWPEKKVLSISDGGAEKWSFSVKDMAEGDSAELSVSAVTVPELMLAQSATFIDLLKLDIETAEIELFSRGTERWLPQTKSIVIELHDRFRLGCAETFYRAISGRHFHQEIKGENIFVRFVPD